MAVRPCAVQCSAVHDCITYNISYLNSEPISRALFEKREGFLVKTWRIDCCV